MEKILIFTCLLLLTFTYYKYNYYYCDHNIHKQITNDYKNNFTKIIQSDNYQYDNYQINNLSIDLLPEYKYSLPVIYFMFIVEQ